MKVSKLCPPSLCYHVSIIFMSVYAITCLSWRRVIFITSSFGHRMPDGIYPRLHDRNTQCPGITLLRRNKKSAKYPRDSSVLIIPLQLPVILINFQTNKTKTVSSFFVDEHESLKIVSPEPLLSC